MPNNEIWIEEFMLRVPELSEEEAGALGREAANRLADGLSSRSKLQQLGALDLRVTVPSGMRRSHMASVIAEAILKGLI